MNNILQLQQVLNAPNDFSWEDAIFLPPKPWSLTSDCAVLNMDDLADDEDEPLYARENGLEYVLGIADVQDIVENACEQDSDCILEKRLEALRFYHENDVFIKLC